MTTDGWIWTLGVVIGLPLITGLKLLWDRWDRRREEKAK
jgi:hypothetical protein